MKPTKMILIFIKDPSSGCVKNRLKPVLSEPFIQQLYHVFIKDIITMIELLDIKFRFCFYPDDAEKNIKSFLGNNYEYMSQIGMDLGERMENAFISCFNEGYREIILIGSDLPDLPVEIIQESFQALKTNDGVIGPATDGGYYLIGFTKDGFCPSIFYDMNWSTKTVFNDTIKILESNEKTTVILPSFNDIDTFDDLIDFYKRNKRSAFKKARTMTFLEKHKDIFK